MHSRRAIRESAIQFLYCSDIEGGAEAQNLSEAFWELALESDKSKLIKASAKALLHLNQGRESRHNKLVERSETALATISADPEAEKLKTSLSSILKLESQWQSVIDRITRSYDPGVETPDQALSDALRELYSLNTQLIGARKNWSLTLQDFPLINKRLDPIKAAIDGLQRISDRVTMVENPADFAENPEIKHLQETNSKMESFRSEVDTLAKSIVLNKEKLDSAIESVVDNYKPERIDPVDRAVLRLGAFEILFKEDIPAPVSINECIEISRRFGSSDSPRFINGVLDKIAKG